MTDTNGGPPVIPVTPTEHTPVTANDQTAPGTEHPPGSPPVPDTAVVDPDPDPPGPPARATWGGKVEFLLSCIGYAVGLGNVWRFPHLSYKHGGGAFLVPYAIMLAFLGLPLFFLELAFGQYASLGPITIWKRVCPLFNGLGYAMVSISLMTSIYYQVIIGFTVFYFFASFQTHLPWASCGHHWNTAHCSTDKYAMFRAGNVSDAENTTGASTPSTTTATSALSNFTIRSPAEEFWDNYVLSMEEDTSISNIGHLQWHISLCLAFSWVVVFCCIMKGIKSSGKVVYFTATFPYVVLMILFLRGVTLPGAGEGIKFYLKPDFHKMKDAKVWKDAAVQILYSLGPGFGSLLTMGSYNKFKNNCHKDAIIVALINCATSVFAGFVIFSVLGYMAQRHGVDVGHVVDSGPGLAFIAYPEALALMPGASFWSIIFFFMLFTLGLDSQFAGMECIVTGFVDEFPILYKHKTKVTAGLCFVLFLLGLTCTTQGGMFVIEIIDKFSTSFPLLIFAGLECIIIASVYGFKRFSRDIEAMVGFKPSYYWIACWLVITPVIIFFILIFSVIEYDGLEYRGHVYPEWAELVGWLLAIFAVSFIPIFMVIKIAKTVGSCQNLWWVFRGPAEVQTLNLRSLIRPVDKWGPALQVNRVAQLPQDLPTTEQGVEPQAADQSIQHREDKCFVTDSAFYGSDDKISFSRQGDTHI